MRVIERMFVVSWENGHCATNGAAPGLTWDANPKAEGHFSQATGARTSMTLLAPHLHTGSPRPPEPR